MDKVSEKEILKMMPHLMSWKYSEGMLKKKFIFKDFKEAFDFMKEIAYFSEEINHHPDWHNVYKTVDVSLLTHDVNGLTYLDFDLAKKMDDIETDIMKKYEQFLFEDKELDVEFIETMEVKKGVTCDVYGFSGDSSKDLGIINIKAGCSTPKQRILLGDKTLEGYIGGKRKLVVENPRRKAEYKVDEGIEFELEVKKGRIVQWVADEFSDLKLYEVCFPPYQDGRFENL